MKKIAVTAAVFLLAAVCSVGAVTVSYTHLDVYKRQAAYHAHAIRDGEGIRWRCCHGAHGRKRWFC